MKSESVKFLKSEILKSKRFEKYADFLKGNLKEGSYSIQEVTEFLKKYFREVN